MTSSFLLDLKSISTETTFRIFMIFLCLQMIFSIINASIVIKDNPDKESNQYRYGIFILITSLIWIILAIIAATWSFWFMKYIY